MLSFLEELKLLEKKQLRRYLRLVDSPSDTWIKLDGKIVLNLCSNNYLGLANDKRIRKAAIDALNKYGFGSGASRLVSGNMKAHVELEKKIAKFKNTEACLVFNSGYAANIGIISALVGRGDVVFSDRFNHASIIDGIILSRAELRRYPHKNMVVLENMLKETTKFGRRLIVTDSVFSMDGDIAPLKDLIELARQYDASLLIDEAHATGVLGKNGRGALEYLGLEKEKGSLIQMGTLSKAFGGFGAYVCASKDMIEYLINFSRAFIYTTSLPPSVAMADLKALEIITKGSKIRERLRNNIDYFRKVLNSLGFDTQESESAIIPLIIKDAKLTMEFSKRLLKEGVFAQGIRPPTVPEGTSRIRITIMSTHSKKDLTFALEKIEKIAKELCLL